MPRILLFVLLAIFGALLTTYMVPWKKLSKHTNEPVVVGDLHIAIMCDGNRRYGEKKGDGKLGGYTKGGNNTFKCMAWCNDMNVKVLTLFVFGEDNFKRDMKELKHLFNVMENIVGTHKAYIMENNIQFKLLTTTQSVPDVAKNVFSECRTLQKDTQDHTGMVFQLGLGYGGTSDIEQAALKTGTFKNNLKTKGIQNPDILIRTSGEKRLSNFMLYQLAYTELFFLDMYWPEFTKRDLVNVVYEYNRRNKRFGK